MTAALAFAFHFDRPLCQDLSPVESLLELPLDSQRLAALFDRQTSQPLATGRVRAPRPLRWSTLADTIRTGELIYFGLHATQPRPDAEQVGLSLQCAAPDQVHRVGRREVIPGEWVAFRYEGELGLGGAVLARATDVDALAVGIFERFAARIELIAGVVVAAPTLDEAESVARCGGGMPGTPLFRRTNRLWGARRTWGPYAREPEWGTFLTSAHADAIGGLAAIREAVEPFELRASNGLVFVQLSPYAQALEPIVEDRRRRLETLMAPVLGAPSSRLV